MTYLFVVTWESAGQDGSQNGVFAQRYAGGLQTSPEGSEFQVNTYTTSDQSSPEVASDQSGNFVVVWQSEGQDGDGPGVFGQRFSSTGVPMGGEFRVNSFTTLAQGSPDVAADQGGGFMVVWESAGQDGSDSGIFGQRYSSTGAPLGAEFRVNTYTTGAQRSPAVASGVGNFVVTWEGESADDQLLGIRGQRYSSSGVPLGGEFRVNTYTTGDQRSPAVSDIFGEFTIAWQSDGQDGSGDGVFGQRYAAAGSPAGPEFRVNTYTFSNQSAPALSASWNSVVVLWQSDLQDGSATGIYSQKYWAGFPASPELRVNVSTLGPQTGPGMAFGGWPRWISPWTSAQDPDGSLGVYAQVWFDLPVELQTFTVE
jgi:hypothetical protein